MINLMNEESFIKTFGHLLENGQDPSEVWNTIRPMGCLLCERKPTTYIGVFFPKQLSKVMFYTLCEQDSKGLENNSKTFDRIEKEIFRRYL